MRAPSWLFLGMILYSLLSTQNQIWLLGKYHDTFCECPKRLMMPWLHRCRCMLVVHHKSLVSWAVLNQAIVEWKCLIQDPSPDELRLSTRWNGTFLNLVFILTVASGCCSAPPSAVVLIDWSSETPLLQLRRHCMYIANAASGSSAYLATTGHDWRIGSGFAPTWRKYSRLPIRTKRNFVVFFFHWVALITLISHENYKLIKKDEWVQCFPQCSVTTH